MNPSDRMWRTLVRVTNVGPGFVEVIIPGWNVRKNVYVNKQAIPPLIFKRMKVGDRLHVGCNIGSEDMDDLCFDNWEGDDEKAIH